MDEQTHTPPSEPVEVHNEYPVIFDVQYPETSSRLLALIAIPFFFVKMIMLIPHIIILYFLQYALLLVVWLGYWVILFTGKYPKGMFNFVVGVTRWQNRMAAWMFSLTDEYPPFSLK